jgi:hypothetical protein
MEYANARMDLVILIVRNQVEIFDEACGSLAVFPTNRRISDMTNPCECDEGFSGPNCNVCGNDNACQRLPGMILGSQNVCNQSPVVWKDKHMSVCRVSSMASL